MHRPDSPLLRQGPGFALMLWAAVQASPALAVDLNSLLGQASQLSDQARQVQSMLPGQSAAPSQQPAPNGGTASLGGPKASPVAAKPGQVVTVGQMQWRADGCSFTQAQEVTCQVTALNQAADKRMAFYPSSVSILDSDGTEYRASSGGVGQTEVRNGLFANGVATIVIYHFKSVNPNVTAIKRLSLGSVVLDDVPMSGAASSTNSGGLASLSSAPSLSPTPSLANPTASTGAAAPVATRTTSTTTTTTTAAVVPANAAVVATAASTPALHRTAARTVPHAGWAASTSRTAH